MAPSSQLLAHGALWGMHAASVSGQRMRLLHDGRARSIEEAILWHDSEGAPPASGTSTRARRNVAL